ncbi:MAG: DNA helicase RecG, partial [bacterium]|nr:DNA helicase RecG [bacterium]
MLLSTPIEELRGVGPVYRSKLKKLGITQVRDLLFHFPHRYEDFSNIIPIAKAKTSENCCLRGKILEITDKRTWRKRMSITEAVLGDETGAIKITWFNQPYLVNLFKKGDNICVVGKILSDEHGFYLSNPIYEKINENELTHTGRIVPVYPETSGLSSRWLRQTIKYLLSILASQFEETIPEALLKEHRLMLVQKAIWQIHFPDSLSLAQKARERFSFEELFTLSCWILMERKKLDQKKAFAIPLNLAFMQKFTGTLPFKLTDGQKKAIWQILKDLEKPRPMSRLLEGDVGSGK